MKQEDKNLLLKDLCARLPYGVKVDFPLWHGSDINEVCDKKNNIKVKDLLVLKDVTRYLYGSTIPPKPYLRPMSSMTKEEKEELYHYYCNEIADNLNTPNLTWELRCCVSNSFGTDWLNAHHFDYRGLIEKGLALEAPKDMYEIKEK